MEHKRNNKKNTTDTKSIDERHGIQKMRQYSGGEQRRKDKEHAKLKGTCVYKEEMEKEGKEVKPGVCDDCHVSQKRSAPTKEDRSP